MQLNLTHINYTYPGTASPAIEDVSATFPTGWTGIIGDNARPYSCPRYCARFRDGEPESVRVVLRARLDPRA